MKNFASFLLLLIVIFGCNQTKDEVSPADGCMPYSVRLETSTNAVLYEYDSQKRVTKIRYTTGTIEIIKYTPDGFLNYIDLSKYGIPNPTTSDDEIKLDSKGRLTLYIKKANGPFESRLSYNSDGHLSNYVYFIKNALHLTTDYIYVDGNLTQRVDTDDKGTKETVKITYYPDLKNSGRITEYLLGDDLAGFRRFEMGYMIGNNIRNLPKRIDAGSVIADFTYEFDQKKRITKVTIQDPAKTTNRDVYLFTYDCP